MFADIVPLLATTALNIISGNDSKKDENLSHKGRVRVKS
jgi:hypothetical protein